MSQTEYIKFKHIIDFYLSSGDNFYESLRDIDSNKIFQCLFTKTKTNLAELPTGNDPVQKELLKQVNISDDFNERLLKVMCLNKAISKLTREARYVTEVRDAILSVMEDQVESEKLDTLI